MSRYATDTHSLYWHITNDSRLSAFARREFEQADAGFKQVFVPGISLIEMVYLAEKGRIILAAVERLLNMLDLWGGGYTVAPLNQATARALRHVPRSLVPDMPDRIIVATALQLNLPLISRDEAIHRSGVVQVLW